MIALQDSVEKLISEVYAGNLHPRVAAGLAPLLNLQVRALEATNLKRRIAELEELWAKRRRQSSVLIRHLRISPYTVVFKCISYLAEDTSLPTWLVVV